MNRAKRGPVDLSSLSCLAPELAEMLAVVACDIALVLDDGGVIRSVALGGTQAVAETASAWVGQRWADTVTGDTRHKAEKFLDDIAVSGVSRQRQLSHASEEGSDIPVAYTAIRLGEQGPTLAVGRDLRAVTAMQQRLVATQQAMEADHWQRRRIETRQRLLFQMATESVLMIDAMTFVVVDANRSAALLFGRSVDQLIGKPAAAVFAASAGLAIGHVLVTALSSGRAVEGSADIAGELGCTVFSVTAGEADESGVLLMSLRPQATEARIAQNEIAGDRADAVFAALVRRTPDAIVVCDRDGRVTLANESFRRLVHWMPDESMAGCELSLWIGADDAEGDSVVRRALQTARSSGSLSLVLTRLRRPQDRSLDVELSATLIVETDSVGFIVRVSHQQDSSDAASGQEADRNIH